MGGAVFYNVPHLNFGGGILFGVWLSFLACGLHRSTAAGGECEELMGKTEPSIFPNDDFSW